MKKKGAQTISNIIVNQSDKDSNSNFSEICEKIPIKKKKKNPKAIYYAIENTRKVN